MYAWIKDVNSTKRRVAIFDATNTTIRRRKALAIKARSEHVYLLFIESICDDPKVLSQNYALKLQNDDYRERVPEDALDDFMGRVKEYEKVCVFISNPDFDTADMTGLYLTLNSL